MRYLVPTCTMHVNIGQLVKWQSTLYWGKPIRKRPLVGVAISVVDLCPIPWLVWSFVGCFVGIFGVVVIGTAPDPVTTGPLASLVGTLSVADPVGAFVGTSTPPEVTTGSAVMWFYYIQLLMCVMSTVKVDLKNVI